MKWYVVWVGNNPGIYETWEDCKLQVENFPGARYKAFKSREEAIMALRGDNESEMGILRSIANANRSMVNYEAFPDIIVDSIAVDAACSGNPGVMEYRGVSVRTGEQIFHKGPFPHATNNIGEFLAIVHALALMKQQGNISTPIYSDSRTGMAWVRDRVCKSKLQPCAKNAELMNIVRRAEVWLQSNTYTNRIIKWDTEKWGEIPADFGRK
ncbi:MAG: viroplasmin family protein [Muribaculaceae bacterium]